MLTDTQIERRCRYRLAVHGMKLRKAKNDYGTTVYYIVDDFNTDRPEDDDPYRWMNLDMLSCYCTKLAERDAEHYAEQRLRRKEHRADNM